MECSDIVTAFRAYCTEFVEIHSPDMWTADLKSRISVLTIQSRMLPVKYDAQLAVGNVFDGDFCHMRKGGNDQHDVLSCG
jgi:hypothetical protein